MSIVVDEATAQEVQDYIKENLLQKGDKFYIEQLKILAAENPEIEALIRGVSDISIDPISVIKACIMINMLLQMETKKHYTLKKRG